MYFYSRRGVKLSDRIFGEDRGQINSFTGQDKFYI